jgi:hypothetical protein
MDEQLFWEAFAFFAIVILPSVWLASRALSSFRRNPEKWHLLLANIRYDPVSDWALAISGGLLAAVLVMMSGTLFIALINWIQYPGGP